MTALGRLLNTVDVPQFPCPRCGRREQLQVYLNAVRWLCGHTKELPPITAFSRYRPKGRRQ